ncbi:Sodium:solute symporter family-domain-containing protein, partial [Pelagophyceae sp. CCMP2097]
EFIVFFNDSSVTSLPTEGSCCQKDVCNIPCPADPVPVESAFGIAVIVAITIFCFVGICASFTVKGDTTQFFVAGRTLNLPVAILTLASQCIDSNAVLGNADLAYKFQWYDGACLPLGVGISLLLNGIFLAEHINEANLLTLPDLYARKYGPLCEVVGAMITVASFLALMAGNLVGCGTIIAFLLPLSLKVAIGVSGIVIFAYTITGGLLSVAYADFVQAFFGLLGVFVTGMWAMQYRNPHPPESIGFPGYMYPDDEVCAKYSGVTCVHDTTRCCYNAAKWCPSDDFCVEDNGGYWWSGGDRSIFASFPEQNRNEMLNPHALTPFPSGIFFNWATIFILSFGNLAALDFQGRCMAAKTPKIAKYGCYAAGVIGILVAVPIAYLGAITRYYYGPDSVNADFAADTCSRSVDFPTCAQWLPDPVGTLRMLTHEAPRWIGGWALIGIVAASMSTCSGAILAMSTVASHNLFRRMPEFLPFFPKGLVTHSNQLTITRLFGIPCTVTSILIAYFYGSTSYLLIVAFDIVLAGCVVPIFTAFYVKDPSPNAGLASMILGSLLRVILEFTLPKDGNLIIPFKGDEFLNYGKAKVSLFPTFFDVPEEDKWSRREDQCEQKRLRDFTGVDSIASPILSLIVFFTIHWGEKYTGR